VTLEHRHLALHALDVELDLLRYYTHTPFGVRYSGSILKQALEMRLSSEIRAPTDVEATAMGVALHADVLSGDVFAVTSEILDVLEAAAPSVPNFILHEHDLPSLNGFVYFERAVHTYDVKDRPLAIRGLGWHVTTREATLEDALRYGMASDVAEEIASERAKVIVMMVFTEPSDEYDSMHEVWLEYEQHHDWCNPPHNMLSLIGCLLRLDFDYANNEDDAHLIPTTNDTLPWKLFLALVRFIDEKWVDPRVMDPDRPRVRRFSRHGRPPPTTKVVQLRRSEHKHHTGDDAGEPVEWSHRWFVRGHWRMQAFGPERSLRRPTWIAEHIKGPEDKPLVVHDKIFSVER
jgi:hypothetical protein